MGFSRWLCSSNSAKNMLVKIVHPGGHVELHDRPVMASEIMLRNPKCIVALPHIFKDPRAVVAPETVLNLGQKFYVVPVSTIRKLQRANSLKDFPSPVQENQTINTHQDSCTGLDLSKDGCFSDDNCFNCLTGVNIGNGEDSNEGTNSPSSFISSEKKRFTSRRKKNKDFTKGSQKKFATMEPWQPSLQSIDEEYGSN